MQDVIKRIIIGFDFDKVQEVMEFLNWTWSGDPPKIPTVAKLITTGESLLGTVSEMEENEGTCETGGFKATKYIGEEDEIFLSLEFQLELYESCKSWAKE